MTLYEYTCARCGSFEIALPIGTAPAAARCAACGAEAPRRFSAPSLPASGASLRRAREAAERSAYEPVVTAGPPASPRVRPRPPNPLQARLPRP